MEFAKTCLDLSWEEPEERSDSPSFVAYEACKRIIDVVGSIFGLVFLAPFLLLIGLAIRLESCGCVIFRQTRIGKDCSTFQILKFRTMHDLPGATVTLGCQDPRVTRLGRFLRHHRIDELPQLVNILMGDMSLVGPRPEVKQFINLNDPRQRRVFSIRPGLTAPSSLALLDLGDQLAKDPDPMRTYTKHIVPMKIQMNLRYLEERNLWLDFSLIATTISKVSR